MRLTIFAFALLLSACGSPSTKETAEGSLATTPSEPAAPALENVCLWNELGVRETPSDKGKYLTSIYLGERLAVTGDSATETTGSTTRMFYKVTLSDGKSGWVRSEFLAKDMRPAAVVTETSLYKRPDAATVSDVTLAPVEYVAAWPVGNGWAKVKTKRKQDKWFVEGYVQERNLLYDKAEVDFAVLAKRANESDKEQIKQALLNQLNDPSFSLTKMSSLYFGDSDEVVEYAEELADYHEAPWNDVYEVRDLPDLNSSHGHIVNIYGMSEYWYVWSLERYKLEETAAEAIQEAGVHFYHCTQEQLNALPIVDKVLDYIPQPMTAVH